MVLISIDLNEISGIRVSVLLLICSKVLLVWMEGKMNEIGESSDSQ